MGRTLGHPLVLALSSSPLSIPKGLREICPQLNPQHWSPWASWRRSALFEKCSGGRTRVVMGLRKELGRPHHPYP